MKNKALKTFIYGLSSLLVCLVLFSFTPYQTPKADTVESKGFKVKTIIVDAGHGGRAAGATTGAYSLEKNVTLAIALKLQAAIEKEIKSVKVYMTRTEDVTMSLRERSDFANSKKGNVYISIHCNSLSDRYVKEQVGTKKNKKGKRVPVYKTVGVPDRSGHGALILVYGSARVGAQVEALRENAYLYEEKDYKENYNGYDPNDPASVILLNAFKNKYRKQSIQLANLINKEIVETDGRFSEGVKEQVLFVLDHTAMPSVLVETGYINNHKDEDYLNSEVGQQEIVNSIVRALKTYIQQVEYPTQQP